MTLTEKMAKRAAEIAAPVFQANRWTWWGDTHIPTESEIMATYNRLANSIGRGEHTTSDTGRLYVRRTGLGMEMGIVAVTEEDMPE